MRKSLTPFYLMIFLTGCLRMSSLVERRQPAPMLFPSPSPSPSPSPAPTPNLDPQPNPIRSCTPFESQDVIAYYVSPQGNDGSDGSLDHPFRTFQRARDVLRALKAQGLLNRPAYVFARGGVYRLTASLTFLASDAGTASTPITYLPYHCERVVISGGTKITSSWSVHSGRIHKTPIGSLRFNSLFVNDRRAPRARTPNLGSYFSPVEGGETYLKFNSGELSSSWRNLNDVEIAVLNTWEGPRFKIASISGNTVNFNGSTGSGRRVGYWMPPHYYADNVFEGLDSPGEWYLDRSTSTLYYWPREEEDIATADLIAPVLQTLVSFDGVSYLHMKYFEFSDGDWSLPSSGGHLGFQAGASISTHNAISYKNSSHCTFEGNVLKHVGAYGVGVDNSQSIRILGNAIFDTGAGGVKVGPQGINFNLSSMPENNITISDNTIHDNNAIYKEAIGGVWILLGANNTVSHNKIYNHALAGISVGWNWSGGDTSCRNNLIQHNLIHDVMLEMNDSAGIYTLGKQPGTVVSHNIIHDVYKRGQEIDQHIFGIYLDEGSSNITIRDNLVYRTSWGLHQNGTQNNTVTNNIFVDILHKYPMVFYMDSGTILSRNIIYYSTQEPTIAGDGWSGMGGSNHNVFYNPNKALNKNNLVGWNSWPSAFEQNSRFSDPLFRNQAADDYTLRPESPAFAVGFVQPDFSGVGPRAPY